MRRASPRPEGNLAPSASVDWSGFLVKRDDSALGPIHRTERARGARETDTKSRVEPILRRPIRPTSPSFAFPVSSSFSSANIRPCLSTHPHLVDSLESAALLAARRRFVCRCSRVRGLRLPRAAFLSVGGERVGFFSTPEVRDVFVGPGNPAVAVCDLTRHRAFFFPRVVREDATIASPHLTRDRRRRPPRRHRSSIHDATSAAFLVSARCLS